MRALHFADFVFPHAKNGSGVTALQLTQDLLDLGIDSTMVSRHMTNAVMPGEPRDHLLANGTRLRLIPEGYEQEVFREKYDCIVVHHAASQALALEVAAEQDIPIYGCVWVDYKDLCGVADRLGIPRTKIIKRHPPDEAVRLNDDMIESSDTLVVPSSYIGAWTQRTGSKVIVPSPDDARGRAKRCKRRPVRIAVGGRLADPFKGMDRVMATLRRIVSEFPDLELLVLGKTSDEQQVELRSIIREDRLLGADWIHSREEYYEALRSCDVFLSLPYWESYGLMLAESISCGLVPVTTEVGLASDLAIQCKEMKSLIVPNELSRGKVAECASEMVLRVLRNRRQFDMHQDMASTSYETYLQEATMLSTVVANNCLGVSA